MSPTCNKKWSEREKEIQTHCKMATPGPWVYNAGNGQIETVKGRVSICTRIGDYERLDDVYLRYANKPPSDIIALLRHDNSWDMEFIEMARSTLPELLSEIGRLREANKTLYDEMSAEINRLKETNKSLLQEKHLSSLNL